MRSSIVLTCLTFFVPAIVIAQVCEVRLSREHGRQFEVHFPNGRLVSVVGHIHEERTEKASILYAGAYLRMNEKLGREMLGGPYSGLSWDRAVKRLVTDNEHALTHFQRDQATLEKYLVEGRYSNVNVEMREEALRSIQQIGIEIQKADAVGLRVMGVSEKVINEIRLLFLGPVLELELKKPKLFSGVKISTAEADQKQIDLEEKKSCRGHSDELISHTIPFLTIYLSLQMRLQTENQEELIKRMTLAEQKATYEVWNVTPLLAQKHFRPEGMTETFEKEFGIALKDYEKEALTNHFRDFLQTASSFKGCSARDLLMARNLARQQGNSLLFVGTGHSAALARYLVEECRAQMTDGPVTLGTR